MFVSTNTFQAVVEYYRKSLSLLYEKEEIEAIIAIVFEHFKGITKSQLQLKLKEFLSESELLTFHFALKRLVKGEPIQYVLGETYFYGLKFIVNEHVLIPRPETEELVEKVLNEKYTDPRILEMGTGSGCIAIALKNQLPTSQITAVDICEDALNVAQINATLNVVEIDFKKHDVLDETKDVEFGAECWDVIVSNPPYIPMSQLESMHKNVVEYEPHLALFVANSEPLIFYKRIAMIGLIALKKGGKIFVEISDSLGNETAELFHFFGYKNVQIIKDINQNDRIVIGEK